MTTMEPSVALASWTPDDSTFGARLALVRQRMRWGNVKEAAQACGIPTESWRDWEQERAVPRHLVDVATRVADRTGCDLGWLLAGSRLSGNSRVTSREVRPGVDPRGGYPVGRAHPGGSRRPVTKFASVAA